MYLVCVAKITGALSRQSLGSRQPAEASLMINPFHRPAPREYEVSAYNLAEITPVEGDRELFTGVVSVLPVIDSSKLLDHHQKREFLQYFDYY